MDYMNLDYKKDYNLQRTAFNKKDILINKKD